MQWQAISRERARNILAAGMQCALRGEGLRISSVAECLRTMLYQCSAPTERDDAWEAPTSLRLTGMVRRRLVPLWPALAGPSEPSRPSVLEVLESLAELGDMVRLEGGRWLAAPLHAVRAAAGTAVILGGGPLDALPRKLASNIAVAGRARILSLAGTDDMVELWKPDAWIGTPVEGLDNWSQRCIVEAGARLTDAPADMGEIQVYLRRQWVPVAQLPTTESGMLLGRAQIGASRSYFLGRFSMGRLGRLASIGAEQARRLRFGLDAQAHCGVRIEAVPSGGGLRLRLARRLPREEARVLQLGWRIAAPEGERSEFAHHVFPAPVFPIVRQALEGLGIVVSERVEELAQKGKETGEGTAEGTVERMAARGAQRMNDRKGHR